MTTGEVNGLCVFVLARYLPQTRVSQIDIEIINKERHSKQWRIRISDEERDDYGLFKVLLRKLSDIGFDRIRHDLQ